MQSYINGWCGYLIGRLETATPTDFMSMAVMAITVSWLMSRFTSR